MPRLIFWNVSVLCAYIQFLYKSIRVVLFSYLSYRNAMVDMVVSRELNPETALKAELDAKCSIVDIVQDYVKVA